MWRAWLRPLRASLGLSAALAKRNIPVSLEDLVSNMSLGKRIEALLGRENLPLRFTTTGRFINRSSPITRVGL